MEHDRASVWASARQRLDGSPNGRLNLTWEVLGRRASAAGDSAALVFVSEAGEREVWTFAELFRLSRSFASLLGSLGIRRGDRVGGVFSQTVEPWICAFGTWALGAVYVPLFSGFGTDALSYRLTSADCRLVIHDAIFAKQVHAAVDRAPDVLAVPANRGSSAGDLWDRLGSVQPLSDVADTAAAETCTIMFTSGTTGLPKACKIPQGGFVSLIPFGDDVLNLSDGVRIFAGSEASWSYGLFTTGVIPLFAGSTRISYSGRFDPGRWWSVIETEGATHLASAPTAIRGLVRTPNPDGLALEYATTAGEALEPALIQDWQDRLGFPIQDAYGLTEVGMVLGNPASERTGITPGSMGRAISGFDVRLLDDVGIEISGEGTGELAVSAPHLLSSGYENTPEAWDIRINADGLFLTSDLANRDSEGILRYRGRKDDLIVSAGYNIGPSEVEATIAGHPGVREVAVVAKADLDRGSVVKAVVVPMVGYDLEALTTEISDLVRQEVGRHAYPREVVFVDELPRTETGKVLRRNLRDE